MSEGQVAARSGDLTVWAKQVPRPWVGALEATLLTGLIYDFLRPFALSLEVVHPAMLRCAATSSLNCNPTQPGVIRVIVEKRSRVRGWELWRLRR